MRNLIIIAALLFTTSAHARTAGELETACTNSATKLYCMGYIAGFYDGQTTSDYGVKSLKTCPPYDPDEINRVAITYEQMAKVFVKWIADNPNKLHYPDWQAVHQAFAEAWPCE
jgi:hypothetical protein